MEIIMSLFPIASTSIYQGVTINVIFRSFDMQLTTAHEISKDYES